MDWVLGAIRVGASLFGAAMSTPHAKLRKEIADWLTAQGAWVTVVHQSGYGRKGIPDLLCCWRGRFLAIEVKCGKDKPTPWQERELTAIANADGAAMVARNLDEVQFQALRMTPCE